MTNKFAKGDRVRIITDVHGAAGRLFVIEDVEGNDDVPHETPYRDNYGYWYKASDLVMVQPAYAKEYAIGAQLPATPPTGAAGAVATVEGLSAQIVHAQMVLQDALGYKENDYHISLTDLAADIASLRQQLAACQGALETANTLLTNLEINLPRSEPNPNSTGENYSRSYSAWTCGELIRAYQKAASD